MQAARQWWKKFTNFLIQQLGFIECTADCCLLYRQTNKGICYFIMYVDDAIAAGTEEAVIEVQAEILQH